MAIGAHTVGKWALRIALECFLVTARKQSLGQGNMFTGVCLSTGGQCLVPGGGLVPAGGGGVPAPGGAWWRPPPTAIAASGTHPTGMHSCVCACIKLNIVPMVAQRRDPVQNIQLIE